MRVITIQVYKMNIDNALEKTDRLVNTFLRFDANHVIYIILLFVMTGGGYILNKSLDNNTQALKQLKRSCASCRRCEVIQFAVAEKVGVKFSDLSFKKNPSSDYIQTDE